MRQQIPVCTEAQLHQGESFDWINSGTTECHIKKCDPPLEQNHYVVPAGGKTPAKVRDGAEKKSHEYCCECGKTKTNPHIIIS